MTSILYTIIIYPLIQIIETAFMVSFKVLNDKEGLAIIGVSLAVSFLCLPLYIVAEKWQETERSKQTEMKEQLARFKRSFKGDEHYMIVSTYYRQEHYHPLMALRSSFGILIQIPFFIAAYTFLSKLEMLHGKSFLFIKDLGKPDALFYIKDFPINVLPLAMTFINLISGAIYTKGLRVREKLQVYIPAVFFLVLLYNSPAGLVVYWTMNNIFSLVKNIFYKMKRPLRVLYILLCVFVIAVDIFLLKFHTGLVQKRLFLTFFITAFLFVPLLVYFAKYLIDRPLAKLKENDAQRFLIFLLSGLCLAVMAGIVIPSYAISSSVVEFSNVDTIKSPMFFLYIATIQAFGLFVFWPTCVYFLFNKRVQSILSFLFLIITIGGMANAFLFSGDYGSLNRVFLFDRIVNDCTSIKCFNLLLLFAASILIIILIRRFSPQKIFVPVCSIFILGGLAQGVVHINKIEREYKSLTQTQTDEDKSFRTLFHLSKQGKNVVFIMMDRAENAYAIPMFTSYPELYDIYTGFTLYSHTLSYDGHTLLAAPSLFGGYEYTPLAMNERNGTSQKEKNNEAVLLMSRIFTEQAGFEAQAADLPWANYNYISDMSICDPYPHITGYNLEGKYTSKWIEEHPGNIKENSTSKAIIRNLLRFSIFKFAPLFLRPVLYYDGTWWNSEKDYSDMIEFLSSYSCLDYLPELTDFTGGDTGTFVCFVNDTTHSSHKLQAPDFEPSKTDSENTSELYSGFSTNGAMYRRLGEWIQYLKDNDCYDNTRIIIVSDHGIGTDSGKDLFFTGNDLEKDFNPDHNHPLLLVKDFGATGRLTIKDSFMTNADVPSIAFKGIVENPVNPFTNNPIRPRKEAKAEGISSNGKYDPGQHGTYSFDFSNNTLYSVENDMSNLANWHVMQKHK